MEAQCVSCLISRAFQEVQLATTNLELQLRAMSEVINIINHSLTGSSRMKRIPAYVGTLRDQAIQQITGCHDPYAKLKQQSNTTALKFLPSLETFVNKSSNPERKFRNACLVASLGNVIEYGVAGHEIPWENLEALVAQTSTELAIDHISQLFNQTQNARTILYLTDNAGEIVFDRPLIQTLSDFGSEVTVAVKGAPVLNDAMLSDAKTAKLGEIAKIVTTGGGAVGVLPKWCSHEFLNLYSSSDLVIAKGMGHHETLPEFCLPTPTAHLLRTKCEPIAHSLGVPKGRNIVNLLIDHEGPLGPLVKN